jgi:hypothetical protein
MLRALLFGMLAGAPADASPDEYVMVRGRVIDEARIPQAGARVMYRPPGADAERLESAEDGSFRLRAGPIVPRFTRREPGAGLLITQRAKDGSWRAATGRIGVSPWLRVRRHVGHFVLQPAFVVRARVLDGSRGVEGAKVHVREGAYGSTALDVQTTGADGTAAIGPLPAGRYEFFAMVEGYRRGHAVHEVTPESGPVTISLTAPRDITIRVVDHETQKGIADAAIEPLDPRRTLRQLRMPPASIAATDADGRTHLQGAGRHVVTHLVVRAPGYPRHRFKVEPDETEVTFAVRRGTHTIRWPLADTANAPPDGTELRIIPPWATSSGPPRGHIEMGHVVVSGWLKDWGLGDAAAPDGSVADLSYDIVPTGEPLFAAGSTKLVYRPTRFIAPRTLDLRIREWDGTPAPRRWIAVEHPAFLFDAAGRPARGVPSFARTDAAGCVAFQGIYDEPVTVKLLAADEEHHDVVLGVVPLARIGQGPVTFTLPRPRPVRLSLRVDGRQTLPADLEVAFDGKRIHGMTEDPIEATLAFRIRHKRLDVIEELSASAGAATGAIEVALAEDDPIDRPLELATRSHHSLRLRVVPGGVFNLIPNEIQLHRWDEAAERWVPAWQQGRGVPPPPGAPACECVVDRLQAGRYRAVDGQSGVASGPVVLGPGIERPTLVFDRSRTRTLRGRLHLPTGLSPYEDFEVAGEAGVSYQLLIDAPGWVPVVVGGVEPSLQRPPTHPVRLEKGSRVHVRFDLPPGARVTWTRASATSEGKPVYVRRARGERIKPGGNRLRGMYELVDGGVLIEGLGRDRFELEAVVAFTLDGVRRTLARKRTIDVDGASKTSVVFDLRR